LSRFSSLGRRQLADHLAELGYLPRLLETGVAVLAGYPFLALAYPGPALLALPVLAVMSLWLVAQARMSAYINVAWVFALRTRQQMTMLAMVSFLSQWAVLWIPCVPAGFHYIGINPMCRCPKLFIFEAAPALYFPIFLGLVWLSRRIALKLA
jgi:hypothetical protein